MKGAVSIYLRLIDYQSNALTSNGTLDNNIVPVANVLDKDNAQFIHVTDYSSDIEQELNIGSQSSGAGAGKIKFNPFKITKYIDAVPPALFLDAASGKAFKTAEVFFIGAKNIVQVIQTYKLVAVKTVSWSAASAQPGMIETLTFEYGGQFVTVNQHGPDGEISNVLQEGWNSVKNVRDTDLNSVIS